MNSIADNLEFLRNEYFTGKIEIDGVDKHHGTIYDNNYMNFEKDYYQTLINSDEEIQDEIIALLRYLDVHPSLWGRYFTQNLTVSQFFKELAKDHENSLQLNGLIDLIIKRRWRSQLILLRNAALGTSVIAATLGLMLYPTLTIIAKFLIETANILPILGIIFSFGNLFFSIYLNHLWGRKHNKKLLRDDILITISSIINIAGKVALVAKTMFAPYAAFFFIAASLIDTLKELFFLLELRQKYLNKPAFAENDPAIIHQQYARHEYDYIKQRNALIINFISALTLTALVITCSFLPVGVILTIATCASIASIYLLKQLALYINEKIIASKLQTELKEIGERYGATEIDIEQLKEQLRADSVDSPNPERSTALPQARVIQSTAVGGSVQPLQSPNRFFLESAPASSSLKPRKKWKNNANDTQPVSPLSTDQPMNPLRSY